MLRVFSVTDEVDRVRHTIERRALINRQTFILTSLGVNSTSLGERKQGQRSTQPAVVLFDEQIAHLSSTCFSSHK